MSVILLVEDVEDNRELARMLLEVSGYDVIEAHTGTEAIAQARAHRPALILMDLSLPEMDGWEATRLIQADPATAHIPIVAVTAHAMAGDRDRVMAAGFVGYITKPIEVSGFADEVGQYLSAG
ncbi:Polar-differentiation response regulator DivK [compost metagenome]